MSDFIKVAQFSQLPNPGKQLVQADDRMVVLFRIGDELYCLDDVCTHDGGPLGEGDMDGYTVACPRHGARFDIRDGRPLSMPATEPTVVHEVKIQGDDVYVRINE
jgi:3-phenylpropionate/trans-cinnamate dioxygenase ferredoxin subunit